MSGDGGDRTERFVVPAGKRAVVRHITLGLWQPGLVMVQVHGIVVCFWDRPTTGDPPLVAFDCRFTAYAGESIEVAVYASSSTYAVDGFLFRDELGEPDDAANEIVHHPARAQPKYARDWAA